MPPLLKRRTTRRRRTSLSAVEALVPWLVVSGLFVVLRQLERWLHQHIFKVGWLITKDFQTTTILYYTFLLPGVILHEVVFWLAAGLFNVRAEGAFQYPKAQQIGELKLNFVTLSKKAPPFRVAIINLAPLAAGVFCVWFIANNVFGVPAMLDTVAPGTISAITAGLGKLLRTPDFWLWFYVAFAIANTMIPDPENLVGIRYILPVLALAIVIAIVIGVGNEVVVTFLSGPMATVLNVLSTTLAVVIVIDSFVVGVLAIIENTIELITGDSADFRNGKMETMTREQRLSRRQRRIEKERRERQSRLKQISSTDTAPSIYKLPLPLPGNPDDDISVTDVQNLLIDDKTSEKPTKLPKERDSRAGASLITGPPDEKDNSPPQLNMPNEDS